MDIVDNLRIIRKEQGYSQSQIAEILETTQQQYSKYEKGIHEIPIRHVVTLCRFYKVSADWLLGLKEMR